MCVTVPVGNRLFDPRGGNDEALIVHTHGYSHKQLKKRLTKWFARDKALPLSYGTAGP